MTISGPSQLLISAAEFIADQAAAVFTFGIAEAALPLLYAAQNRIISGIVQTFEVEVMTVLVEQSMHPIRDRIRQAAAAIRNPAPLPVPQPEPGMRADTEAIRAFAADMDAEARAAGAAGQRFAATIAGLRFIQD
jgi:hypothetical protein